MKKHNLLTLATAHPKEIRIQAFGKKEEAKNGADWKWGIVGDRTRSELRVQAKRVSRDGFVRNLDYHNQSVSQLEKLLQTPGFLPIICFYASDDHRTKWTIENDLKLGCLFADARKVLEILQSICNGRKTKFSTYEDLCYPWHHLKKISNAAPRKRSITQGKLKDDQRSSHQSLITTSGSPDDVICLQLLGSDVLHGYRQRSEVMRLAKLDQGVIGRITINLTDSDHDRSK